MSYETPHTDAALAAIKPAVQADIDLHVKAAKAAFGAAIAEGKLNTAFQAVEQAKAHDQAAAAEMATELLAADELKRTGAPTAPKPRPKSAPKKTRPAPAADPVDDANIEPTPAPAQPAAAQAPDDGEPAWLAKFTDSRIKPMEDKLIEHDDILVGNDTKGGLVKDVAMLRKEMNDVQAHLGYKRDKDGNVSFLTTVSVAGRELRVVPALIALIAVFLLVYIPTAINRGFWAGFTWWSVILAAVVSIAVLLFTNRTPNSTASAA